MPDEEGWTNEETRAFCIGMLEADVKRLAWNLICDFGFSVADVKALVDQVAEGR